MEVLGDVWFTSMKGTIGIVVYNNGHEIKAKICNVAGDNIDLDIKTVIDWGSTFPMDAALMLTCAKDKRLEDLKETFGIDLTEKK